MSTFNALYFPSWNPPVQYLRSVLLFFDRIEFIIPEGVEADYRRGNARVFDLIPDSIDERRESYYTIGLKKRGWKRFERALDDLVEKAPPPEKVGVVCTKNGLRVEGCAFVHKAKLNDRMIRLLKNRHLLDPKLSDLISELRGSQIHVVEERASCLVLSLIADTLAQRHGLRTITDEPVAFTLNALNGFQPDSKRAAAQARLASTILTATVPRTLQVMTAGEYAEFRKRFESIRTPFQRAIRDLCDDHLLYNVQGEKELAEKIGDITRDYRKKVDRFQKTKMAESIRKWRSFSIGTLLKILGSVPGIGPKVATFAGGVALRAYDEITTTEPDDTVARSQRLVSGMRDRLLTPKLVRSLVLEQPP